MYRKLSKFQFVFGAFFRILSSYVLCYSPSSEVAIVLLWDGQGLAKSLLLNVQPFYNEKLDNSELLIKFPTTQMQG